MKKNNEAKLTKQNAQLQHRLDKLIKALEVEHDIWYSNIPGHDCYLCDALSEDFELEKIYSKGSKKAKE
jgi:murein tripeptide amidase MpaA